MLLVERHHTWILLCGAQQYLRQQCLISKQTSKSCCKGFKAADMSLHAWATHIQFHKMRLDQTSHRLASKSKKQNTFRKHFTCSSNEAAPPMFPTYNGDVLKQYCCTVLNRHEDLWSINYSLLLFTVRLKVLCDRPHGLYELLRFSQDSRYSSKSAFNII